MRMPTPSIWSSVPPTRNLIAGRTVSKKVQAPMRLRHTQTDDEIRLQVVGDLLGSKCQCLEHYWYRYVQPQHRSIIVDLTATSQVDAEAMQAIDLLIREASQLGQTVQVLQSDP